MNDRDYIALGKAFELFLTNDRFRVLGTACLGKPGYQHMGLEIWTEYKDFPEEVCEDNKRQIFTYILGMKGISNRFLPSIEDLIREFQ